MRKEPQGESRMAHHETNAGVRTGDHRLLGLLQENLTARERILQRLEVDLQHFHARLTELVGSAVKWDALVIGPGAHPSKYESGVAAIDAGVSSRAERVVQEWPDVRNPDVDDRNIKELYREAARLAHPDRSSDEALRAHATGVMIEINLAYGEGDRERLLNIVRSLRGGALAARADCSQASGEDPAVAISMIEAALANVQARIDALCAGPAYRLMRQFEDVARVGRDPFKGLAEALRSRFGGEPPIDEVGSEHPASAEAPPGDAARDCAGRLERTWLGDRRYESRRSVMVRSRSLMTVADALDEAGLDWRYEHPIVGTILPGILRPDFVILDTGNHPFVIEHFGIEGEPAGLPITEARRDWFERNGIPSGQRYFLISDRAPDEPDLEHLRKVAEFIKERLGMSTFR